jgi:hypothetical protein
MGKASTSCTAANQTGLVCDQPGCNYCSWTRTHLEASFLLMSSVPVSSASLNRETEQDISVPYASAVWTEHHTTAKAAAASKFNDLGNIS